MEKYEIVKKPSVTRKILKIAWRVLVVFYVVFTFSAAIDYVYTEYDSFGQMFCAVGINDKLQNSVVRIIGGYSQGSGFFIAEDQILTNFHVIADEPSPKIILPNGNFIMPTKILGNEDADLAILYIDEKFPDSVLPIDTSNVMNENHPLVSAGFALGTDLKGKATVVRGNFVSFRSSDYSKLPYIQTSITLVDGMSGGPLTKKCGEVVGINQGGLAGLSLFIPINEALALIPNFTDEGIEKINVDPSLSPEDGVKAFYTYLKARRMRDGFNLLSKEYLKNTNFEEWTSRFKDVLDVQVFKTERFQKSVDKVFVKFSTKNWVNGGLEVHHYEGVWRTIKEDGVYKMLKSDIAEVEEPSWEWFYN